MLRLLAVGGAHLLGGFFAPLWIFPEEFEAVSIGIKEIDALMTAGGMPFEIVNLRFLLGQPLLQANQNIETALEFHRQMVEAMPLAIMLGCAANLEESDIVMAFTEGHERHTAVLEPHDQLHAHDFGIEFHRGIEVTNIEDDVID